MCYVDFLNPHNNFKDQNLKSKIAVSSSTALRAKGYFRDVFLILDRINKIICCAKKRIWTIFLDKDVIFGTIRVSVFIMG